MLSPSCDEHIEWLKKVFDARQVEIFRSKDLKKVMHVAMVINDGIVFLSDCNCITDEAESYTPAETGKVNVKGVWCHVELTNASSVWKKAMANGSTVVFDLKKQYYGGELGCFRDPFGFSWGIAQAGDCRKSGVIPYLFFPDGECRKHIEWMKKAQGAIEKDVVCSGDIVQHAVLEVNGAPVYTSDISGMPGTAEAKEVIAGKPTNFFCHMDVANPHALWDATLKEGAKITMELKMQFWGSEYGMIKDPFDFEWSIAAMAKPEVLAEVAPGGVIPYLFSSSCDKHVEWIASVFGGEVKAMNRDQDNKVLHCCVKINEGTLYICDKACSDELTPREAGNPCGSLLHLNVPNPDAIWKKAMDNGASQTVELKVQFWGDYFGCFKDPLGFEWAVKKTQDEVMEQAQAQD